MGKINVLGFDVANLIAAGEVVDRPASVVKELIENAIDAKATALTVEIKNGGVTFIRVSDDGFGIEYDDLPVAILRHATSKIKDAKDLGAIMTLGFRGEALAAIASVSKMRILSRTENDPLGSMIETHGGEIVNHMECGCARGTTVIVEELFYNVPARRKFLKKDTTEAIAVSAVVEKIALSEPGVAIRFLVDGEMKFRTEGDGDLGNTIYAVLGRDFVKKAIAVDREENGIRVRGYISAPELVRSNRNSENFYINGRYVKSRTAGAAIEQAFLSYIPSDKFPYCVLNIDLSPSTVDVNVHPAKLEVKFSNEKIVFDAVYYAVRGALEKSVARPDLMDRPNASRETGQELLRAFMPKTAPEEGAKRIPIPEIYKKADEKPKAPEPVRPMPNVRVYEPAPPSEDKPKTPTVRTFEPPVERKEAKPEPTERYEAVIPKPAPAEKAPEQAKPQDDTFFAKTIDETEQPSGIPSYRLIGEAFSCYLFVETGDRVLIIDKHAAHERILFEDMKNNMKRSDLQAQVLMLPIRVPLSSEERSALCEYENDVRAIGFAYCVTDRGAEISEIPDGLSLSAAQEMFETVADRLANGSGDAEKTRYEYFEHALYQASCKAAVKGGRNYDEAHVKWICDRVLTDPAVRYCPHGRPVGFEMTKSQFEKRFERSK